MQPIKKYFYCILPSFFLILNHSICAQIANIPNTPKIPETINYCADTTIVDNYRWLEKLQDTSVKQWFKQQGQSFDTLVSRIPERDTLLNELFRLDRLKSEGISNIKHRGNCYFFIKTLPGEDEGKLYIRIGKNGKDQILFDPNSHLNSHKLSISFYSPSLNALKLAVGVTEGGGEVSRILIMDVKTKELYKESIYPCRYGVYDWSDDNSAFYYTAHPNKDSKTKEFGIDTKLMLHRIGTDPVNDHEVFSKVHNPEFGILAAELIIGNFSDDRKYFVITLSSVGRDRDAYYTPTASLNEKNIPWKHLISKSDHISYFVFAEDSLYLLTFKDASNSKIIVTSAKKPDFSKARTLLPESDQLIKEISGTKGALVIVKFTGTKQYVLQYDYSTGVIMKIPVPGNGSADLLSFGSDTDECLITVESCTRPNILYDFDTKTKAISKSVFDRSIDYPFIENMEEDDIEVPAKDGVMIPVTIIYPKGMKLDSSSYCILEVYGAYGRPVVPYFSLPRLMLIHHGVFYAFAHIRGGGEKGEAWHKAAMKQTKKTGWNDAISCAEYLIQHKYTSSRKLALMGASAGGIVAGRAITERPDLFAVLITYSANMNPLLSEFQANGPANIPEFGSVKIPDECRALIAMDPLYHVKDGVRYPAIISMVGMNDPRVVPWAQAKFIGAVQNASTSGRPVMLRVSYNTGHSTDNNNLYFKDVADRFAFTLWAMGHPDFHLKK